MTEEIDFDIEETIVYVAQSIRNALGITVPKDFIIPVGPTYTCEAGVVTFTYTAYYPVNRLCGEYSIEEEVEEDAGMLENPLTGRKSWL